MRWRNLVVGVVLVAALGLPAVAQEGQEPAEEAAAGEQELETAAEPADETEEPPEVGDETEAAPEVGDETEAAPEVGEPPREEPPPFVLPQPTATPATPGPGAVLLADNFDDPTRAQLPLSSTGPDRAQGYVDREYEIINGTTNPGGVVGVNVPGRYFDSTISVDARVIGGIQGLRAVHVTCRSGGGGSYVLRIWPDDRRATLLRRQPTTPGSPAVLADQRGFPAVRPGEALNHLELTCAGSVITGSVNGAAVVSIQDASYSSGGHQIEVRGSGTTVRFDNLVVTQR